MRHRGIQGLRRLPPKGPIFVFLILFMSFSIASFGQSWSIGPALLYGDDIDEVGFQVRGYYNFANDKVCFGPEYSQFLSHTVIEGDEEITKTLNEINFNIHYVFEIDHYWGFYALSGLNLSREKEKVTHSGEVTEHKISKFGTNLGMGIHRNLGKVILFAEYDHLFSELRQNSFLLGMFFTFGKKEHAEEGGHH